MTFRKDKPCFILFFCRLEDSHRKTLSNGNSPRECPWKWLREWRLSQQMPPGTAERISSCIQRHSICAFFPINCLYVGVRFANVNKGSGPSSCPRSAPISKMVEATRWHCWHKHMRNKTKKKKKNKKEQDIDSSMGFNWKFLHGTGFPSSVQPFICLEMGIGNASAANNKQLQSQASIRFLAFGWSRCWPQVATAAAEISMQNLANILWIGVSKCRRHWWNMFKNICFFHYRTDRFAGA